MYGLYLMVILRLFVGQEEVCVSCSRWGLPSLSPYLLRTMQVLLARTCSNTRSLARNVRTQTSSALLAAMCMIGLLGMGLLWVCLRYSFTLLEHACLQHSSGLLLFVFFNSILVPFFLTRPFLRVLAKLFCSLLLFLTTLVLLFWYSTFLHEWKFSL